MDLDRIDNLLQLAAKNAIANPSKPEAADANAKPEATQPNDTSFSESSSSNSAKESDYKPNPNATSDNSSGSGTDSSSTRRTSDSECNQIPMPPPPPPHKTKKKKYRTPRSHRGPPSRLSPPRNHDQKPTDFKHKPGPLNNFNRSGHPEPSLSPPLRPGSFAETQTPHYHGNSYGHPPFYNSNSNWRNPNTYPPHQPSNYSYNSPPRHLSNHPFSNWSPPRGGRGLRVYPRNFYQRQPPYQPQTHNRSNQNTLHPQHHLGRSCSRL